MNKRISSIIICLLIILIMLCSCSLDLDEGIPNENRTEGTEMEAIGVGGSTESLFSDSLSLGYDWYLSEWNRYPSLPTENTATEKYMSAKNITLICPIVYEENTNGVNIKVEFFQDSYTMYSLVQTRITITNTTEDNIKFNAKSYMSPGAFVKNGDLSNFLFVYQSKNFASYATDDQLLVDLSQNESYVIESVFYMYDYFFELGNEYEFIVEIRDYWIDDSKIQRYKISVPIKITS